MSESEKLSILKVMIPEETDEEVLSIYLSMAARKICRKAYPYKPNAMDVPEKYAYIQIEIAAFLLNKRGAEGQISHSENGISRQYEDGDVPPSMLRDIVPFAAIV